MIINEQYKIESDYLNITLFKKRSAKKSGKERWDSIAYFSHPQTALEYLVELEVMGTGMKDFQTVISKIDELNKLINQLNGLPEVADRPEKLSSKTVESRSRRLIPSGV